MTKLNLQPTMQSFRKKNLIFLLLGVCVLGPSLGCVSRGTGDTSQTIENQEVTGRKEINFKLKFAVTNQIPHKTFRENLKSSLSNDPDFGHKSSRIHIEFGKVTEAHYKLLMERYGGQNLVPFDPEKNYDLVDFLPPKIQALVNRWLITSWTPDANIPEEMMDPRDVGFEPVPVANIDMNCWAASYEVLRDFKLPFAKQKAQIGMFLNARASHFFSNSNAFFQNLGTLKSNQLSPKKSTLEQRNQNRKLMDVLSLIYENQLGPAHTALWIDEDLYFEKTNSGSEDPFRLNTYEGVVTPFLPEEEGMMGEIIKFSRLKTETLPDLEEFADQNPFDEEAPKKIPSQIAKKYIYDQTAIAGGGEGRILITRINNFKMVQDPTTKRATIPDAAKLSSFFQEQDVCRISESNDKPTKFIYRLDKDLTLRIFGRNGDKQGVEIAKIKGKFVNGKKSNPNQTTWIEFPSGDKVLRLYERPNEFSVGNDSFLDHPGVDGAISVSFEGNPNKGCIREIKHLKGT